MSSSITRIGDAFDLGPNTARLVTLLGLVGAVAIAALATRQGILLIVLALALGGIATVVGLRWPLLPLLLFAALIPIEQVVIVEGLGTISRLAGILFAVCYGVPRLGQLSLRAMPPAAWAYLAWARGTRGPIAAAAAAAVLLAALALSYSISSFGALLAGLLVVAALRWSVRWALAGGAAILVCGAIFLLASGVGESDLGSAKNFDTTTSGRVASSATSTPRSSTHQVSARYMAPVSR